MDLWHRSQKCYESLGIYSGRQGTLGQGRVDLPLKGHCVVFLLGFAAALIQANIEPKVAKVQSTFGQEDGPGGHKTLGSDKSIDLAEDTRVALHERLHTNFDQNRGLQSSR